MQKKRDASNDIIRPLTIGVVIIMAITVIILQLLLKEHNSEERKQKLQPENFAELINDIGPNFDTPFEKSTNQLSVEELNSAEVQFSGRDSSTVSAFVSKPAGTGPFPVIVIVHDTPASQRSSARISTTVGEKLAQQHQAVVLVVDWKEGSIGQDDMSDVVSSIDFISQTEYTANQPVIIMGIGYGAYLSFLASNEIDIAGIISIGGYYNPASVFEAIEKNDAEKEQSISERGKQFLLSMGCDSAPDPQSCLEQLSVQDALPQEKPILLIHMEGDSVIPVSELASLRDVLNANTVEVQKLQLNSTQHDTLVVQSTPEFTQTMDILNTWLQEQLNTPPIDATIQVVVPEDTKTDPSTPRTPIYVEVNPNELLQNASEL